MMEFNCSQIFFTSDTHFFHKNIIQYCNRPFKDIEEMNEKLIENWNNVVPYNGIVFHLGDVSFSGKEKTSSMVSRLNGKIYLVRGNHDGKNINEDLFEWVSDQMMIKVLGDSEIPEQKIFMHHFPFLTWPEKEQGCWQLFGHTHQNDILNPYWLNKQSPGQLNIGLDNNEWRPFTFDEVKIRITKNFLGYDRTI